jgi:hypothetical protein
VIVTTRSSLSLERRQGDSKRTVATAASAPVVGGGPVPERTLVAVTRARRDEGRAATSDVRRSSTDRTSPGTIIAAYVRARLLGIKILTIDARIVHVGADSVPEVARAADNEKATKPPTEGTAERRDGRRAGLAYAMTLLEESSKEMDDVRGVRAMD